MAPFENAGEGQYPDATKLEFRAQAGLVALCERTVHIGSRRQRGESVESLRDIVVGTVYIVIFLQRVQVSSFERAGEAWKRREIRTLVRTL